MLPILLIHRQLVQSTLQLISLQIVLTVLLPHIESVKPNNAHAFSNRIDFECVDAKRRYFDAQRLFKHYNSRLNRHNLLECKRFDKPLIRRKKIVLS